MNAFRYLFLSLVICAQATQAMEHPNKDQKFNIKQELTEAAREGDFRQIQKTLDTRTLLQLLNHLRKNYPCFYQQKDMRNYLFNNEKFGLFPFKAKWSEDETGLIELVRIGDKPCCELIVERWLNMSQAVYKKNIYMLFFCLKHCDLYYSYPFIKNIAKHALNPYLKATLKSLPEESVQQKYVYRQICDIENQDIKEELLKKYFSKPN